MLERLLHDLHTQVYFTKRNTLNDDMFAVAHGIDPYSEEPRRLYENISGDVGMHFDAHGINKGDQLGNLVALLRDGIDPTRAFYTAPFEVPDDMRAALAAAMGTSGGTAYKGGIAVVTAGYDEKISTHGIKHVFVNDVYQELVPVLQQRFPNIQVHKLSDQKMVLEREAVKYATEHSQTPPNVVNADAH